MTEVILRMSQDAATEMPTGTSSFSYTFSLNERKKSYLTRSGVTAFRLVIYFKSLPVLSW